MAPASTHGEHFAEVVLVRHGQTDWNVSRIIQGRIDQELNETGRQQAAKVARRLSEEAKPAAVYSSDLKRASQTAQTIAAHCCVSDSDLVIDRALTERHMGLFQGWTIDDAKRSEAYKAFARGGRDQEIPGGGESLDQLSERCVSRLNAIAEKHKGERVVVVSHEAVIEEICRHADPTISVGRKIPNTSISVVHVSGSDSRWILEKFGDAEHLTGDGFPQSGPEQAIQQALSEDALCNKGKNKQVIGSHKTSRKVINSKREKSKEKIDEIESEESRKKIKK
ncbi:hypothetical protein SETIT_8G023400v2 [Setaria italica]|nr:phosphoglycerate mutase-like protein 4 [Setaria italica]RCV36953.1 hypothetical protein SETIT_8G023400v2 [Setaria italica]